MRVGLVDENGNSAGDLQGTDKAAHIADVGRAVQPHNRYIELAGSTAITDVEPMSWLETEGVYSVRFKVMPGTAGTPGVVGEEIKVVFDASPVGDITDVTQANTWLTAAGVSPSIDVEYFELVCSGIHATLGVIEHWSDWFKFNSPLRRADFLAKVDKSYFIFAEVK